MLAVGPPHKQEAKVVDFDLDHKSDLVAIAREASIEVEVEEEVDREEEKKVAPNKTKMGFLI